jgi:two-component system, cell cycle sensor histidine kinase and response regulator CckA
MSGPSSPAPSRSTRPAPRGAVLFADDEEAIRWLGRRFLEADGWVVLEASDGEEALEVIENHPGKLSLVVTDLNMPKVSGRELAEVLSVFCPDLPVLGITGFLSAVNHDRRLPILPKPFTAGSLVQAVRMSCGIAQRSRTPAVEKRRRARRLRELTPAAQTDLRAAVRTLRTLEAR